MALSPKLTWDLANPKWAAELNPLLGNSQNNARILKSVPLVSGVNNINHLLGKTLQGWSIVRRRQYVVSGTPTAYDIYDTQDSNQTPQLTLKLTCSQGTLTLPVLVDISVF